VTVDEDIAECQRRLDRLHDGYLRKMLRDGRGMSRAQTTTYNARAGSSPSGSRSCGG
jgi:hypothetical protein